MTRRRLTPDEIELWRRVASQAERMHPLTDRPAPLPKPRPHKPVAALPRTGLFEIGQSARGKPAPHDLQPSLPDRLAQAPVQMDRKTYSRMKRGRLKPEARIDLHGKRLDAAHSSLIRFILSSQASGRRLVLVITGKGKPRDDDSDPIPTPRGVLRHQVPQWLALPPLAQAVMQVAPAHVSHGGGGAYYVYLRKGR